MMPPAVGAAPEPLEYKPGEYYYRVRYQRARSRAQRDELFYSLARDHQELRNWVREAFEVEPPTWEFTGMEARDKPWLMTRILKSD